MLLAALTGAVAGALVINRRNELSRKRETPSDDSADTERMEHHHYKRHTGIQGDVSEIYHIMHLPGVVVKQTPDVDLYGAPCVWHTLRNGAKYRSYETKKGIVFER